jgi:hypothetical protein
VKEGGVVMLSLEEVLLSLKAKDTITLSGEAFKIKNIIAATDGKVLKAHLILIKPDEMDCCVNIEISTRIHEKLDLSITNV